MVTLFLKIQPPLETKTLVKLVKQTGRGCQAQDRLTTIWITWNHTPWLAPPKLPATTCYNHIHYAYPCLQWHPAVIYSPREHQRSPFHKITELHCKVSPLHMALLGTPTDIRWGTSGRSCTAHHLGVNGSKNGTNKIQKLDCWIHILDGLSNLSIQVGWFSTKLDGPLDKTAIVLRFFQWSFISSDSK